MIRWKHDKMIGWSRWKDKNIRMARLVKWYEYIPATWVTFDVAVVGKYP